MWKVIIKAKCHSFEYTQRVCKSHVCRLNMGTLINWIMANINYRAEVFQKCWHRCAIWKLAQVCYTHKFFPLIRSILGQTGGLSTVLVVQAWFSGRNRDHTTMSQRSKPHVQHLDRLMFDADVCVSLSAPPLRAPSEIVLKLVFQTCQHWGRNRLHTCLFCVCISLIICGDYCMCSIPGLNSGLLSGAIWQTSTGKGVETKIFTVCLCEGKERSLPFFLMSSTHVQFQENVLQVTMSWSHGLFMDFCLDHLQIPLDLAAVSSMELCSALPGWKVYAFFHV